MMVRSKAVEVTPPLPSLAVTVIGEVPGSATVPEMTPFAKDAPVGNPATVMVKGSLSGSVKTFVGSVKVNAASSTKNPIGDGVGHRWGSVGRCAACHQAEVIEKGATAVTALARRAPG